MEHKRETPPPEEPEVKWPKRAMLISKILFWVSLALFLLCVLRLSDRVFFSWLSRLLAWLFFQVSTFSCLADLIQKIPLISRLPDLYTAAHDLFLQWCCRYMRGEVISQIFIVVGIVNFSYSYVASARNERLYGIYLNDVMQAQFPLYGKAYGLYGLCVIIGLYCSAMNYLIIAAVCLLGALCSFCSTGIVTYLFVSNQDRKREMVEYYLCHSGAPFEKKRSKNRKATQEKAIAYMGYAADYIRAYYLSTQAVPEEVTRCIWRRLRFGLTAEGLPAVYPPEQAVGGVSQQAAESSAEAQLCNIYQAANQIAMLRPVWEHLLRGLSPNQQADLLRQVLEIASEALPACPDEYALFRSEHRKKPLSNAQLGFGLPLCALLSCLRNQAGGSPQAYWNGWQACIDLLYQLSAPQMVEKESAEKYYFTVRLLFLLMETLLLVEVSAQDPSQISAGRSVWLHLSALSRMLHVSPSWIPRFLPWGQSISASRGADWYDTLQSLSTYDTYLWICEILNEFENPDYE